MASMNSELFRALTAAGVSDDMATKAAESVASYDKALTDIRLDIQKLDAKYDARTTVMQWMLGLVLAGIASLLGIAAKAYLHF